MRRAVITVEWDGPDKPVREYIEDAVDRMFEAMTYDVPKLEWATTNVEFTAKVKQ